MSQAQDTVELLDEQIEQWADACREIGSWHGRDVFQETLTALNKRLGGRDYVGRPIPSTHRVLPKPFLVEWAAEIAKARWRISQEWFERQKLPFTWLAIASRLVDAQREGHNRGVDSAVAFARMPYLQMLTMAIGTCASSIAMLGGLLGRGGKAA